jgi:MoaA/NifB/PqqE/SkfB family radical SAM enzyme
LLQDYSTRTVRPFPRLPLKGSLDLTYRCNFNCRHCWLRIPPRAPEKREELSLEEIRAIVDESRAMGCREWAVSGGEPMLRPDFLEIFDYITRKTARYSLNTNGSLITPEIAQLMRRTGTKMVALYGATAEVHDHITRTPGAFELTMRGFAYLQETGAGFIVQLIPLRANFHQWDQMVTLAQSLSHQWRVGAPWLYLSCDSNPARNREIAGERLLPRDVIELDKPDPTYGERMVELAAKDPKAQNDVGSDTVCDAVSEGDDRLFAQCIANRRDFHIDPYGQMTFCCFIKDPALRYDLRQGTFHEAWEEFIPSLGHRVRGGDEYRANCGACELRKDCRWCAVYAYLETGRYSAPIPYLCAVADEARKFNAEWQNKHRRYFQIAGITVRVESDLDFDKIKFKNKFAPFTVEGPGDDNVIIRHHFELPDLKGKDLGKELYRKPPWAVSRKNGAWFYQGVSPTPGDPELHRVAVFNADHTRATIYSPPQDGERLRTDGWHSLSLFPTDLIWLGPLLADRNAVLLHSAAAIVNGQGLIFVGHSEAGKSTTMEMLKAARAGTDLSPALTDGHKESPLQCEILCDDRNVIRKWPSRSGTPELAAGVDVVSRESARQFSGEQETASLQKSLLAMTAGEWRVHGTWSHGTTSDVSSASAPLRAILFLKQATVNEITPLTDRKAIWRRLLATLIRPVVTAEWWEKELDVLEQIVNEVPFYTMRFDRSGTIVAELVKLTQDELLSQRI